MQCNKFCCSLPPETRIGKGVVFPHNFPLVVNPETVIGEKCIIHPNVLIGRSRNKQGAPIIGNHVFIGNGSKIFGNCKIGDWCFITPGSIVTKDIPSGSIVGAGLNNIISDKGKDMVLLYS